MEPQASTVLQDKRNVLIYGASMNFMQKVELYGLRVPPKAG